jgi:ATP-dependent Clp protease protease subunit
MSKPKRAKTKIDEILGLVHGPCINPKTRELWVHGMVSPDIAAEEIDTGIELCVATRVIKNIGVLQQDNPRLPIIVHLHSCGGLFDDGMAIYDALKALSCPVVMINWAGACSMASIIFQAATTRLMMPHSYLMFHSGQTWVSGTPKQAKYTLAFQNRSEQIMLDIYTERLANGEKFRGQSPEQIRKTLVQEMDKKEDVYLTAEEAVQWGFADDILKGQLTVNINSGGRRRKSGKHNK